MNLQIKCEIWNTFFFYFSVIFFNITNILIIAVKSTIFLLSDFLDNSEINKCILIYNSGNNYDTNFAPNHASKNNHNNMVLNRNRLTSFFRKFSTFQSCWIKMSSNLCACDYKSTICDLFSRNTTSYMRYKTWRKIPYFIQFSPNYRQMTLTKTFIYQIWRTSRKCHKILRK